MPYCQVTPCLERGTIVLYTRLCVPEVCDKAAYDASQHTFVLHSIDCRQIRVFRPTVHLRRSESGIPRESGFYAAFVSLVEVEGGSTGILSAAADAIYSCNEGIDVGGQNIPVSQGDASETSVKPHTKESVGNSHDRLETSTCGCSFVGEGVLDTDSKLAAVFGEDSSAAVSPCCSTVALSESLQNDPLTIGFRGLDIARYCLETISAHRVDGASFLLTWRIRIYTRNLRSTALSLAAIQGSNISCSVSRCDSFVLRCKRCCHVIERVANATLVPLPSDFYTSTTGSTFCEECEPHLVNNFPALARADGIIYQGEDVIILYRPGIPATEDGSIICISCRYSLGNFSDCSRQFVRYRKSCVSGSCGELSGDLFWRYSPAIEAIESLQYDKRARVTVGPVDPSELNDSVPVKSELSADSCWIEIIKVVPQPDTFIISNKGVFEASRIVWRRMKHMNTTLHVKLPRGHFERLLGVLQYFSQEADPLTGYTPSILLAI